MIENLEKYEIFTTDLLRQVELLQTEQLRLMIANYFGYEPSSIDDIMWGLQRNNTVLYSPDGWACSMQMYKALSHKEMEYSWMYSDSDKPKMPPMSQLVKNVNRSIIKSLWIIADMMPQSVNIMRTNAPFDISFCTDATEKSDAYLYQFACVEKGDNAKLFAIANAPRVSPTFRPYVKRICIVGDESEAYKVPHVGFIAICVLDRSRKKRFRVVEVRKGEDVWSDAQ